MREKSACALLLIALIVLAGCSGEAPQAAAAAPQPEAVQSAPQVATASASQEFVASGPIVVENQLDIAAQRDGVIADILVDTGTLVRKGQLLATLDDRQLIAERDAAQAQAEGIQANLNNWEATVKMSQADLERSEKMWAANLITKEQLEHNRYKLIADKYDFDRETKSYQRSLSMLKSLDLELEKAHIVAPFDGVVARRYIRKGQHVVNGDKLFWVSATAPMHVKFTLPEKLAGTVARGSLLEVLPVDLPSESHPAKVLLISPVIDPASGTLDVTAELTGNTGSLKPGMIMNIRIPGKR